MTGSPTDFLEEGRLARRLAGLVQAERGEFDRLRDPSVWLAEVEED
jgi:hypothetical protein